MKGRKENGQEKYEEIKALDRRRSSVLLSVLPGNRITEDDIEMGEASMINFGTAYII